MTPFGHVIFGISCGNLSSPPKLTMRRRMLLLLPFALIANVPDLALKGWGHDKYYFSHSVFVSVGLICTLFAAWLILCSLLKSHRHLNIAIGLSCAWLSHLLIDSFYNHGHGIRIFWPLSDSALALPIPWLNVMDVSIPYFAWPNTKIYLIEILTFAPILLLSLVIYHLKARKPHLPICS
jgi:hypothetical protein